jgi:hypothetical protein
MKQCRHTNQKYEKNTYNLEIEKKKKTLLRGQEFNSTPRMEKWGENRRAKTLQT